MIRAFNYTHRQKILLENVAITLSTDAQGQKCFDARIELDSLNLPREAQVYVEAYRRTSYIRYDFGTVGKLQAPDDRHLHAFDATEIIFFRVKVVDRSGDIGKILAEADGIKPSDNEESGGKLCLLHVECRDLGDLVWKLEAEDPMPVLVLNDRIEGIREIARHDKGFFALVYPEVVRQVLHQILIIDTHDPTDDGNNWRSLWLQFIRVFHTDDCPEVEENGEGQSEQMQWIQDAVSGYCASVKARDSFIQFRSERGE